MGQIDDLKRDLALAKAAYKTLASEMGALRAEYDKIKAHLGSWHSWAQTIENVPKRLLAAARKFLGL